MRASVPQKVVHLNLRAQPCEASLDHRHGHQGKGGQRAWHTEGPSQSRSKSVLYTRACRRGGAAVCTRAHRQRTQRTLGTLLRAAAEAWPFILPQVDLTPPTWRTARKAPGLGSRAQERGAEMQGQGTRPRWTAGWGRWGLPVHPGINEEQAQT